jgi:hypothetical protein
MTAQKYVTKNGGVTSLCNMKIRTENYLEAINRLPKEGQHILGYQHDEQIVVYQAYNQQIADFAIETQTLGGNHFSYNRMSWIKPNFLWMMYRCGWASKENQERVLAIWLNKADFENILRQGVFSSFDPDYYNSYDQWKLQLAEKEVRLQWDPDHDPSGGKLARRAIQVGMKGIILERFGKEKIKLIEDITEFVREQKFLVDNGELDRLIIPIETVWKPEDEDLRKGIGVDS